MRLTNYIRDAFIEAAMQDVPAKKVHTEEIRKLAQDDIFTRLPLSSADSTNAAVNSGSLSRFGSYLPPTVAQRAEVIAERIEANNSAP